MLWSYCIYWGLGSSDTCPWALWLLRNTPFLSRAVAALSLMWAHQTLSCFMAVSSSHHVWTDSRQWLHTPHRTKNPFTEGLGDRSSEINSPWATGSCPLSPMGTRVPPCSTSSPQPCWNRGCQKKPGLCELAKGREGSVGARCVKEVAGRDGLVLPLRLWETCGLPTNGAHLRPWWALLHPRILLPWPPHVLQLEYGLGKSDTPSSQKQGNCLERRGGRKSTKTFDILYVICTWHSETFKCLN